MPEDCITNYDDNITVVPKPASLTTTKVPKPYTIEPNGLFTEDCRAILNEDGTQLLAEIG
jgi:hypothetical protein